MHAYIRTMLLVYLLSVKLQAAYLYSSCSLLEVSDTPAREVYVGDRYQLLYSLTRSSFGFSAVLWGNNNKMAAAAAAGLLILVRYSSSLK